MIAEVWAFLLFFFHFLYVNSDKNIFLNCLVIFLGWFVKLARCKPEIGLILCRSKLRTGSISSWSNLKISESSPGVLSAAGETQRWV